MPNDPGVLGLGGPEYWAIAFDCERRNLAEKVMEASSYGGLSLNLRESTWQVVASRQSCESSTPANLLLSPADLLVRIRSQDQTGCASPAPSLPPNSYLSIGTTFPYFAPSSAPRALNLLIPRVTFGRCLASYVSRRSTHLASTNSTTACSFPSR